MTRYEHGFLTKCAEHGVDGRRLLVKTSTYKKWPKLNKEFRSLIRRVSNAYTGKTDLSKLDTEKAIKAIAKRKADISINGWHEYMRGKTNSPPPVMDIVTPRDRAFDIQSRLRHRIRVGLPPIPARPYGDIDAALEYIGRRIADANKIID